MFINNIVVGAGLSGAIMARRLAEEKNEKVLIVEKNSFIGGSCYDYRDSNGILIHKFGPHIFRTDNEKVYTYLSRFTEWSDYQHKVLAYVGGLYYPIPINVDTINKFYNTNYSIANINLFFDKVATKKDDYSSVEDKVTCEVGKELYAAFFENYTLKQWGMHPKDLPKEIVARLPIRKNRDDRYFTAKYQFMPKDGYTAMIQNILNHPNIKVLLNTDFKEIKGSFDFNKLYFSGSIDDFCDHKYGKLPYRCVSFDLEYFDKPYIQSVAVINYPNDYAYTRITEYKHFYSNNTNKTVLSKEFSSDNGNPSYPIPTLENIKLYNKYKKFVDNSEVNVQFIGRLGQYKYYSMDEVVKSILDVQI